MKTLTDLSLDCIANNLYGNVRRLVARLAPRHKELLLERLVYHDRLTPDYLPHVTYNLFSDLLRRVTFYKCVQVTDAVLQQLGASGCKLTHLTIHECIAVTDAGVAHITRDQNELVCLKLRKNSLLTSRAALTSVRSAVLIKVDLRASLFNTDAVSGLLKANNSIKNLILSDCKKLDDNIFPVIAERLGHSLHSVATIFRIVSIKRTTAISLGLQEALRARDLHFLSNASLISIATSCPNLQRLDLHGCNRVTEEGFSQLAVGCRNLRRLDLSYCSGLQRPSVLPSLLSLASPCPLPSQIRELSLCGVMFEDTDTLVTAVSRLTTVRRIRLCGIPALTDSALEQILSLIGGNLEMLDLSGGIMSPLTDTGLESIAKFCTSLTSLGLSMLKVTGRGILPLLADSERAGALTQLQLSCKNLNEEVVSYVARECTALEELVLSGVTFIDDDVVEQVAENCAGRLRDIGLKGCRLVTDVGVCALARYCPGLRCVVLSGLHKITDRSIFSLANGCPYIEEIYLSGCNEISKSTIRYLVDTCIPRVFFEHRVPNADPDRLVARNLDTGLFVSTDRI